MSTVRKYTHISRHRRRRFFTRDETVLLRHLSIPAFITGVGLAMLALGVS